MAKDEMTPVRKDIVLALANNRMRLREVAKELHYHRTTILYHIGIIKSITGKDPMNFYDLGELVKIVKVSEDKWIY